MSVKILVLSDTHASSSKAIADKVREEAQNSDFIVHAGDFTDIGLVNELRELGNFIGVYGNMDSPAVKDELPRTETLEINEFRIGITHPPEGGPPRGMKDRVKEKFGEVDAIIYGHTHSANNEKEGGILFFNPGRGDRTCGTLKVNEEIEGKIIEI